jgi:hypothetical protein
MEPNQPFTPPSDGNQPLTEQQIRALRSDLGSSPSSEPPRQAPAEPHLNIPSASDKPVFDADEPAFSPNTINQLPQSAPAAGGAPSVDELIAHEGKKKTMLWIMGGGAGVIVLGLVGYFAIYPMLSSVGDGAPTTPDVPGAVQPNQPVQPAVVPHVSAFVNEPESKKIAVITGVLSRDSIVSALVKEAQAAPLGTSEIQFRLESGAAIPFGTFLSALAPGFTDASKANLLFVDDFTAYLFKDEKGSWPGFVATLRPNFAAADLRSWFAALEKSPLSNFFIVSPGTMSEFKDGVVNGKYPDRYAPGTTPGASLGYLMLPTQNKVLISSSFVGMKEGLRLMGL